MTRPGGIIIFGDEIGLPAALSAADSVPVTALVVDPQRRESLNWVEHQNPEVSVLLHPSKLQRDAFCRTIAELQPALGVIFSYGRILWPELTAQFPCRVVNLHGGRLPKYRGANVLQWAIINGETETAATLHYVDEHIDSGPIIDEATVAITDEDTAFTLRERILCASSHLLAEWLPRLVTEIVPALPQKTPVAVTNWPRRTPEDGLIDWSWPNERIRNLTRALVPPWPGAYYFASNGEKVVINRPLSLDEVALLRRKLLK